MIIVINRSVQNVTVQMHTCTHTNAHDPALTYRSKILRLCFSTSKGPPHSYELNSFMAAAAAVATKKPSLSLSKACIPSKGAIGYACKYCSRIFDHSQGRTAHVRRSHKQQQEGYRPAAEQQRKKGIKRRREEHGVMLPGGVKMDDGEGMEEDADGEEQVEMALQLLAAAALKQEATEF